MRRVKLGLAALIVAASSVNAVSVEMFKPYEALEQAQRARIELEQRQWRQKAERQKREKEQEGERRRAEAEQRDRERKEKAQQEADRKRNAAATKAAQNVSPPPTSLPPQPSASPMPANEPRPAPLPATGQAADGQTQVQSAPSARAQVDQPPPTASSPVPAPTSVQATEGQPQARSEPAESQVRMNQGQEPRGSVESPNPPAANGSAPPSKTTSAALAAGRHAITVTRLNRMVLYSERGDKLGDVEQVVQSPDGSFHIVIGAGGFLGIRERDVPIPLDGVVISGRRLVVQGLTADQVKAMPVFNRKDSTYREVARDTTVLIGKVADAAHP
jgi:hypothetical protein